MIRRTVPQKTISNEVELKGVGLHTGKEVNIKFKPAPVNTGLVFIREDLLDDNKIDANIRHISNTDRGTNIDNGIVRIQTSEHVLAALVGLGVDNCFISLNGPEVPIMDGSSKNFIEVLERADIKEQNVLREEFFPDKPIIYKDKESGSEISLIPYDNYSLDTTVDYGTKVLGTQKAYIDDISEFKNEISTARTFSFLHELEMLLDDGKIDKTSNFGINEHCALIEKIEASDVFTAALNENQIQNLANYFVTLPSELAMSLWKTMSSGKQATFNVAALHGMTASNGQSVKDALIEILTAQA